MYMLSHVQTSPDAVRCANSYGVPVTSYGFMTSDGLTNIGDIPYGIARFE